MAVKTPSHVAVNPYANRQILTDLGLLNPKSYDKFTQLYPDLVRKNYIVTREAQNARNGGTIGEYTRNKEFWQWQQKGKDVPSFKVTANATGASAGANVTVTVAAAYHQANAAGAGQYSPPAAGHYYYNDSNGQVFQVVSKNEATPGAHTVVLRPTEASVIADIKATDILIFDVTVVGEASGSQEGIYRVDEKVRNWCATIKTTKKFSDWNLFEEVDMPGPMSSWKWRQMKDEVDLFTYQQERLLMFGRPFTNIAGVENMHTGLIPSVIANGQKDTASTEVNDAFFENISRLTDAEGTADTYDFLMHKELRMKAENFIAGKYTNGAIVYKRQGDAYEGDGMVINRNFAGYQIHGINVNFMTYDHFSTANMVGAPVNTGLYKNAGLLIPRGNGVDPGNGQVKSRFNIRWQGISESGPAIRVRSTGGLAPTPTDDTEKLVISHVATKGLQTFGLNGYIWIQLAA
ncbi:hypothetical protein [Sphingobacterium mizutaii]|uniref:hypothetical protein n=1 Tax=Sphingobacterium mizutaii TaxID=1010 RepID=UPI00289C29A4|nr:hypothetical protein [Sphingobacterium mizutaii]